MVSTVTSVATRRASVKPKVVDDYNRSMNGVDKADQYTVYYSFIRKSVKWWRKLFFWLFEVTIVNSYFLYCAHTATPCTHLQFRQSLVEALVSSHLAAAPPRPRLGRRRKRTQSSSERFNLELGHFPKRGKMKECEYCSDATHGARKRTSLYCKACPGKPSLCAESCFELYHTP